MAIKGVKVEVEDIDQGAIEIYRRLTGASKASLTVGIHAEEGSRVYTPKGGEQGEPITMAELGEIHEFGLGVPQRSFIAGWFDENESRLRAQTMGMAKKYAQGTLESLEQGYEQLGNLYVGEIQRRIAEGIDPPLAPSTIQRKGSSTPLIDTGQLRSSITYQVRGEAEGGGIDGGGGEE